MRYYTEIVSPKLATKLKDKGMIIETMYVPRSLRDRDLEDYSINIDMMRCLSGSLIKEFSSMYSLRNSKLRMA